MKNNAGFIGSTKSAASGMNGVAGGMWKLNEVAEMNQPNDLVAPTWPLPFVPPIEIWNDTIIYAPFEGSAVDLKSSTLISNTMQFSTNSKHNLGIAKYGTGCIRNGNGTRSCFFLRFTALPTTATYEFWLRNFNGSWGNSQGRSVVSIGEGLILSVNKDSSNSANNTLRLMAGSTVIGETAGNWGTSVWKHIAIVVQGTTTRLYEDGVQKGSGTSPSFTSNHIHIGNDGTASAATFELDDFVVTDIARYPDGIAFTPPDEHPTFATTNPVIRKLYDGTGTFSEYAVVQLFSIPSGADGYKITIGGDEDGSQPVYSGVTFYIHNPTDNQQFTTSGMVSPNTRGTLRSGVQIKLRFFIDNGVNSIRIFAPNDNGATAVTCTVQAIDSNNATVGNASNTLTGMEIDEDG